MPYIEQHIEFMIPNRWPEGVPLGIRNKISRTTPAPFLISTSILPKILPLKTHSSVRWPATVVPDWDKITNHVGPFKLNDKQMIDYINALLMRKQFGISDLADRNFLYLNNRIVSIDEDTRDKDVNFVKELRN
jgi:hypothetical protein